MSQDQTNPHHDGAESGFRPLQTEDLQVRYNSWRDAKASSRFEAGLQLRRDACAKAGALYTGGLSDRRVREGSVDMAVSEDTQPVTQHDHLGLESEFFRAVGACAKCRELKQDCSHVILDELEATYQSANAQGKPAPVNASRLSDTDLLGLALTSLPDERPPVADSELMAVLQPSRGQGERLTMAVTAGRPRMSTGSADVWGAGELVGGVYMPHGGMGRDMNMYHGGTVHIGDVNGVCLDGFLKAFNLTGSSEASRMSGYAHLYEQSVSDIHDLEEDTSTEDGSISDGGWHRAESTVERDAGQDEPHAPEEEASGNWAGRMWELLSLVFIFVAGWAAYERCPLCAKYVVLVMVVVATVFTVVVGVCLGIRREAEAEVVRGTRREESLLGNMNETEWRDGEKNEMSMLV